MLTDPIYGLGPRIAQLVAGAFFREPKQVVELDRDGDKIDLGGISVNIDHTPGHTRGSVGFRVLRRPTTTRTSCSPVTPCSSVR
ncbi:glyoxalase II [Mycobacterium tuberculosis]|nr:glyoxalase II [Mycobacterium tuberculosis]